MLKNFLNLLLFLFSFFFLVSCCHKNIPDIPTKYSTDHPLKAESVVFIMIELQTSNGIPLVKGSGSGSFIRSGDGWTDVLTAGHVCDHGGLSAIIEKEVVTVHSPSGEYFDGFIIAHKEHPDLCLIRIKYECM